MDAVASRIVQRQPAHRVVCAFLELTAPDLPTAVRQLVADGARHITVLPLFLGVGRHAREDLPVILAAIRLEHPETTVQLLRSAGEHPQMIDLLASLALESRDDANNI